MLLHRLTDYLLTHRFKTIALTFLLAFIPVIGLMAIVIAALVTLRKGIVEGGILMLAATLPLVLSLGLSSNLMTLPILVWVAIGVSVLSNILTWIFAIMLRRGVSWGSLIQMTALAGVLVISVIHLIYPDVADWWAPRINVLLDNMTTVWKTFGIQSFSDNQAEIRSAMAQGFNGLLVTLTLFYALAQVWTARWWQLAVFDPERIRKELLTTRLSHLAGVLFVVSLVFAYLGNSVVSDIMPVIFLLFSAAGLSLLHYLFRLINLPARFLWIIAFYIVLVFTMPLSLMFISMIAFGDIWLNVRKRLVKFT